MRTDNLNRLSSVHPGARLSANGEGSLKGRWDGGDLPESSLVWLAASLKKQGKRYRKELRRCQKSFSEETVHELRIAARRLQATLELLAPFLPAPKLGKAHALLKSHLDIFDDLRDTQVQLQTVAKLRRAFPAARAFHSFLRKREERYTRRARREIKRVKSGRVAELIGDCRDQIGRRHRRYSSREANTMLLGSMDAAFANTVRLKLQIRARDTSTIHRTRIAFKRFRYMLETMAKEWPRVNKRLLASMHRYQTRMGDIQDTEVLLQALDRFCSRNRVEPDSGRRLRAELARRRQRLLRTYLHSADQLFAFWPRSGRGPRRVFSPKRRSSARDAVNEPTPAVQGRAA